MGACPDSARLAWWFRCCGYVYRFKTHRQAPCHFGHRAWCAVFCQDSDRVQPRHDDRAVSAGANDARPKNCRNQATVQADPYDSHEQPERALAAFVNPPDISICLKTLRAHALSIHLPALDEQARMAGRNSLHRISGPSTSTAGAGAGSGTAAPACRVTPAARAFQTGQSFGPAGIRARRVHIV